MGISIKNSPAETDIRELAALTGRNVTDAVWRAVRADLARERAKSDGEIARKRDVIKQVIAKGTVLPARDPRPMAEILDEIGQESS
ncbi:MAG: type II toxin-antitoxin system VapB family antitoxin [Pseudomonadota bacterium]